MENENILLREHPTQLLAFPFYFGAALIAISLAVLSGYLALYPTGYSGIWYFPLIGVGIVGLVTTVKYFIVRTKEYVITSERLLVREGIFNRTTEEMELYRIRDWSVVKPFWLRLFNRGHVRLITTDASAPKLEISGVAAPERIREILRTHVESARARNRVRQLEFDSVDVPQP